MPVVEQGISPTIVYTTMFAMFVAGAYLAFKFGGIETPSQTRERQARESAARREERRRESERYDSLTDEGKMLHDLQRRQAGTERYARGIFWFLMAGAIGTVIAAVFR